MVGTQCICNICCCGRHRCPHIPKAVVPWGPCVMSEYSAQFHPHCVEPVTLAVPPSNIFASGDPISSKTTQRSDFVQHPYQHPYKHQAAPYKVPEGRMEDTTLYRNEYTPKNCPPPVPIKPPERQSCAAKFAGQPTYRSDYRPWELPPIENCKPKDNRPPLAKFDGEPIYRRDYTPKCITKVESCKPEVNQLRSTEPFRGDTCYRTDFVPREVERRQAAKVTTVPRVRVPFETLTTNRKDYTVKEYCRNPPILPPPCKLGSDSPLSRQTTNRNDFKDWGPVHVERSTGPAYKAPEGTRYLDSTYRNDFAQKPICPVFPVKMPETGRCDAKFEGTTNYRDDFQPWDCRPERAPKPEAWTPPEAKFDGRTTTGTDFLPQPCVVVPEPIKPKPSLLTSGEFDDRTNYRTDFVPKEVCPCCPAGYLQADTVSPDGYVFDRIDERGHQLYRNVGAGKPMLPAVQVK